MSMNFEKELEVAQSVARKAGEIMLRYFDSEKNVEKKSDSSPVTIADKLINTMVIQELLVAFPDDQVCGEEESNNIAPGDRLWLCDPIDGTAGFIFGTPTSMFSLALLIKGNPVLGVTYDPYLDKLYVGVLGQGSYCLQKDSKKQLKVSSVNLKDGIVAVSGSIRSLPKSNYFQKFLDDKVYMATFSGAVYKGCLIASGRLVAYVEQNIHPHDIAAIKVIVEEAGGKVTDFNGEKIDFSKDCFNSIISNSLCHDDLVKYCK